MRPPPDSKWFPRILLAALTALFAATTFYHLGERPLASYDEAIYAQVSREAQQNHSPLAFTWVGNTARHRSELWFEKPPVMIWLVEGAYQVFGVNEFAARFWTAVFAVLTLPLTFLFTKKISGSVPAAFIAVAALFLSTLFVDYARVLQFDIPVGFFILLALHSFWLARERDRFHLLFWAALALGVLIKSVIGLLPLPIISIFSLVTRDFRFLRQKSFWAGCGLFLALVVPWHLIEHLRYGRQFWDQYLFYHVLDRFSSTLEGNTGGFWFYGEIFFQTNFLFWTLLGLGVSIVVARRSPACLFVAIAFLFIFLFFSAAGTKLPPYILVACPLAATMIGTTCAILVQIGVKGRWTTPALALVVVTFVIQGLWHPRFQTSRDSDARMAADKAVGRFLATYEPGQPVYYQSANSITPSIMFYANRPVGNFAGYPQVQPTGKFLLISDVTPAFPDKTVVFSTDLEKVYQVR